MRGLDRPGEAIGSYLGEDGNRVSVYREEQPKAQPPDGGQSSFEPQPAPSFFTKFLSSFRKSSASSSSRNTTSSSLPAQTQHEMARSLENNLKALPWYRKLFSSRIGKIENLIKELKTGASSKDGEAVRKALPISEGADDWLHATISNMKTGLSTASTSTMGSRVSTASTLRTTGAEPKVESRGPEYQTQKQAVLRALSAGGHPRFIQDIINEHARHVSERTKGKSAGEMNKIYDKAIGELTNSLTGVLGYVTRANEQKKPLSVESFCDGLTLPEGEENAAIGHGTMRMGFAAEPLRDANKVASILERQIPISERQAGKIDQLVSMVTELNALEPPQDKGGNVVFRSNLNEALKKISLQNTNAKNIDQKISDLYGLLKGTAQIKLQAALPEPTSTFTGYTKGEKDQIGGLLARYFATKPDVNSLVWIRKNVPQLNDENYKKFKDELETKTLRAELAAAPTSDANRTLMNEYLISEPSLKDLRSLKENTTIDEVNKRLKSLRSKQKDAARDQKEIDDALALAAKKDAAKKAANVKTAEET